ncbi:N-acetylmuramoyl-L-alanine amidase [Alteromonadaceae bacterium BrNp21-10]|nr:N-acetylmuramoyl-L-alanine amidase [Alteromonadaceae bacterium BrNp21-10]
MLFTTSMTWAADNKINSVRIWPSPDNTRIVLDLDDVPQYSYFPLKNPERLVIDIADTTGKFNFDGVQNDSDLLKKIRYSTAKNKQSIRLVLELNKNIKPNIFSLRPTAPYGNRLVIDLGDKDTGVASKSSPKSVVRYQDDEQSELPVIIAIDAGHGGEDPGSIGYAGSYEKNVTLAIGKALAELIDNEPGMKAIMVRDGDYYVGYGKRTDIARQHRANLFVSIHADAFTTPQPSGASVWVLSMRRADTELGRWLEKSEKHSELLGGAAEIIQSSRSDEVGLPQTIIGLTRDSSMTTSYEVSEGVIQELRKVTKLHKKRPQAASLAVLTSPDIPSILVETGFISNPKEEKNLNWSAHRQKLAKALHKAISDHFKHNPPHGTLLAKLKQNSRTHRVRSGESLSLLAQRYNVSVKNIKVANNLNTDVVRIGQVLTIPRS